MQEEAEKLVEEKQRLAKMEKVLREQAQRDAERYLSIFIQQQQNFVRKILSW